MTRFYVYESPCHALFGRCQIKSNDNNKNNKVVYRPREHAVLGGEKPIENEDKVNGNFTKNYLAVALVYRCGVPLMMPESDTEIGLM